MFDTLCWDVDAAIEALYDEVSGDIFVEDNEKDEGLKDL